MREERSLEKLDDVFTRDEIIAALEEDERSERLNNVIRAMILICTVSVIFILSDITQENLTALS